MSLDFIATQIEMSHGAGGKASRRLVEGLLLQHFSNPSLAKLSDAALFTAGEEQLALSSDSFVVKPLVFPGGSIGELAINGTVNDLAVSGAKPEAVLISLIIEAGLPSQVLEAEVKALARAAREAGVQIIGGDTKVVEHGKGDGLYISSTGIGRLQQGIELGGQRVQAGDKILLSGPIGDHGITLLISRGELDLEADLQSDTRSVWPLIHSLLCQHGKAIHWMRDPTRGGVATALNELALDCQLSVHLEEEHLPVNAAVRGACELLGLDPLHIANEGQFLAVVSAGVAEQALATLKNCPGGESACIIGELKAQPAGTVLCQTRYGTQRVLDMLVGDPLPRIC